MIKNIFKVLMIIILFFMLCGCGMSDKDKKLKIQYEEDAKREAISFIEKKYNINPIVIDSKAKTYRNSVSPLFLSGEVIVTLKNDNKEFMVRYNANLSKVIGDTYQSDIIVNDYIKEIEKIFGKKPYNYFLIKNNERNLLQYFYDYYDGSNLNLFYPNMYTLFFVGDVDIKNINVNDYAILSNSDGTIINYKSIDDYKKAFDDYSSRYHQLSGILMDSIYINDAFMIDKNGSNYYNFSLKQDDEIVAYSISKIDKSINNYEIDKFVFKESNKCNKVISNGYIFNNVNNNLYVYIDLKYIKSANKYFSGTGDYNLGRILYVCKNNERKVENIAYGKVVGDYLYVEMSSLNCNELNLVVCGNE